MIPSANAKALLLSGAFWGGGPDHLQAIPLWKGEKCTATSRAIVVKGIKEEFTQGVVERVKALKIGPGTDESTYLGPLISEAQLKKVLGETAGVEPQAPFGSKGRQPGNSTPRLKSSI